MVFLRAAVELNPLTVTQSSCCMYRAGPWGPAEGHRSFEALSLSHQRAKWEGQCSQGSTALRQLVSQCVMEIRSQAEFTPQGQEG